MKYLYIIGNGFDRHHELDTEYKSFAKYLSKENLEIYEHMINYYGLPDVTERYSQNQNDLSAWAYFESALSELNYEEILEENIDLVASPASAEFRDRDWHTFQIEMEMIVDKLTNRLIEIFRLFILDIDFPESLQKGKTVNLEKNSTFLNFNYTDTLERYYNVPFGEICYIHNKALDEHSQIVLGHGINPELIKPETPTPPEGLTDEELEYWHDEMSDKYDFSYESAKNEILTYFKKSFKDTDSIIREKQSFFSALSSIEVIIVLGHSLLQVDAPYFKEIIKNINPDVDWIVSYHSDDDKHNHMTQLLNLGIQKDRIRQIRIQELVIK